MKFVWSIRKIVNYLIFMKCTASSSVFMKCTVSLFVYKCPKKYSTTSSSYYSQLKICTHRRLALNASVLVSFCSVCPPVSTNIYELWMINLRKWYSTISVIDIRRSFRWGQPSETTKAQNKTQSHYLQVNPELTLFTEYDSNKITLEPSKTLGSLKTWLINNYRCKEWSFSAKKCQLGKLKTRVWFTE